MRITPEFILCFLLWHFSWMGFLSVLPEVRRCGMPVSSLYLFSLWQERSSLLVVGIQDCGFHLSSMLLREVSRWVCIFLDCCGICFNVRIETVGYFHKKKMNVMVGRIISEWVSMYSRNVFNAATI